MGAEYRKIELPVSEMGVYWWADDIEMLIKYEDLHDHIYLYNCQDGWKVHEKFLESNADRNFLTIIYKREKINDIESSLKEA